MEHVSKRYEYNISPLVSDELMPFNNKVPFQRNQRDTSLMSMSPIKERMMNDKYSMKNRK